MLAVSVPVAELEDAFFKSESFYRGFLSRPEIKEMLRIESDEIVSVSPAMAQFFVLNHYNPREIREALIDITRVSFNLSALPMFNELYRSCMQHGRLKELFTGRSGDDEIIDFYDAAKNLEVVKSNPYFWVQYGIARWARRERDLTDSCIANARRVGAESNNFSPYQIDHFEATVRLETHKNSLEAAYRDDVKFAVRVINDQIDDDRTKAFPFKLTRILSEFVVHHQKSLLDRDRDYSSKELRKLMRRTEHTDKAYVFQEEADECRKTILKAERLLKAGA